MSLPNVFFLAILTASAAAALPSYPITFTDALDTQNPADVIGNPEYFEIHYLSLVGAPADTLQVDIRFNFGGGASLSPFNISGFTPSLSVGDLFFKTATADYAFILNGHDGLATSGLYQITGTQNARTVLGNPAGTYRPDAEVWASPSGAQLISTGTRTVSTVNGNSTNLLASLYIPLTGPVLSGLNNGFDVYFASATCGNDEILGTVPDTSVPEPGTLATLGAGLVLAGLFRRNR